MIKRSKSVIDKRHKVDLRERDRWRVTEMLRSQPDLRVVDSARDLDLWRHLFDADDLVVVGARTSTAADLLASEYCWGNIWRNGLPVQTVAYCLRTADLLRGATYAEQMSSREACEAVLGRLRNARIPIVMVVDDGEGGLVLWCDAEPTAYRLPVTSVRRPGGTNSRTGKSPRVLWPHQGTRVS